MVTQNMFRTHENRSFRRKKSDLWLVSAWRLIQFDLWEKSDLNHLPKKQKDPEEKSDPTRIIWPRSDLLNSAFNFFSHHSFLSNDKDCRNYLQIFVSVKKVVIIFQLLFQENSSNEWHFLRWLLKLFQISNEENKEQGMANWKRQDII